MAITTSIKRLLYPLYIYPKTSRAKKQEVHKIFDSYLQTKNDISSYVVHHLRLFSNLNEDGIILKLIASINARKGYFLDIGSNDCINSNCANLAFNFDWKGVFIDADPRLLRIGRRMYHLFGKDREMKFASQFLSPENIDKLVCQIISTTEIDLMSIDIDGNDYAIWKALETVQPKIVVIENKIEYGACDIVVPSSERFASHEHGASIVSFSKLAEKKGYSLVATNAAGFNAFYMRNDCFRISGLPLLALEDVLNDEKISRSFYSSKVMSALEHKLGLKSS